MNHIRRIRRSLAGLNRRARVLLAGGVAEPEALDQPATATRPDQAPTAARLRVSGDRLPDAGRAAARGRQRRRKDLFATIAPGVLPRTIQLCVHCLQRPAGFWIRHAVGTVVRRPWCLSCCQELDRNRYDVIPFGG